MNDEQQMREWLASEVQALREQIVVLQGELSIRTARETELSQQLEYLQLAHELSLDALTILRSVQDGSGQIVDFVWEYANPAANHYAMKNSTNGWRKRRTNCTKSAEKNRGMIWRLAHRGAVGERSTSARSGAGRTTLGRERGTVAQ